MRIKEKLRVCRVLGRTEFFTPATIERFVAESHYRQRNSWSKTINEMVSCYLEAKGDDICRQRKNAFRELCLMELQTCMQLPEVVADEQVTKYMKMVGWLYDGSSIINKRDVLQNATNNLELKILHSISTEDKTLVRAFLKVVCMFSYKILDYHTDDKRRLEELCNALK